MTFPQGNFLGPNFPQGWATKIRNLEETVKRLDREVKELRQIVKQSPKPPLIAPESSIPGQEPIKRGPGRPRKYPLEGEHATS